MVIVSAFFCVAMAWGIGANDVANFFGAPVGAKAITLKRAMIIAFIFEFIGGFFLGSNVTNTIRKKITDFSFYDGEADILLLGMFSALLAAAVWVYLATKYSLPVSTTQSIVGAIIGFVLVSKGTKAVEWEAVTNIIIFWVGTPLMGMTINMILYWPARHFLLMKDNSYQLSLMLYPIFVFLVLFIMCTFLGFKGFKRIDELGDWAEENPGFIVLIGIAIGALFGFIAWLTLVRTGVVSRYAEREQDDQPVNTAGDDDDDDEIPKQTELAETIGSKSELDIEANIKEKTEKESLSDEVDGNNKFLQMSSKMATSGLEVDVFDDLTKEEQDLQKFSIKFDPKTERLFEWLSVLAATFGIFAHGSNDIANAIAPFTSIYTLSLGKPKDDIDSKNEVAWWILFLGSIFMSIGCVTYGYNVIRTLGVKLTKLSPTRSYFTLVASALVIIIASNYGFPASTTHAQVGSTIAIGLVEKYYADKQLKWNQIFNWKLLLQVFLGWIGTIVIAGSTSALIFSVLAYSPCL